MADALQGIARTGTQGINITRFDPPTMAHKSTNTTEAAGQISCRTGGVYSKLQSYVSQNSLSTAATTITTRKNSAAGSQTITVAAGATGLVSDLVNTDTVADGDEFGFSRATANSGSGTILNRSLRVLFTPTSNQAVVFGSMAEAATFASASSTTFITLAGESIPEATENEAKMQVDVGGSLSDLQIYVTTARATNSTLRSRVNNGNGNLAITLTAATTGFFEDASNSDTLVSGDDINVSLTTGTGADNLIWTMVSALFTNTSTSANDVFMSTEEVARTASATASFYPIVGSYSNNDTTVANQNIQHNFALTNSKMKVYLSANTYSANGSMISVKNSVAGSQTITLTAAVTGLFQDTSNSDTLATTDDFCFSIDDGTSGSITIQWMGSLETVASSTTIATFNGVTYSTVATINGVAKAGIASVNGVV